MRRMGYFFECGPNIQMLQMEAGRKLPAGTPSGHRAMFLLSGKVRFSGREFEPFSYFMLPEGAPYDAMEALETSELLAIGWTLPGKTVPLALF